MTKVITNSTNGLLKNIVTEFVDEYNKELRKGSESIEIDSWVNRFAFCLGLKVGNEENKIYKQEEIHGNTPNIKFADEVNTSKYHPKAVRNKISVWDGVIRYFNTQGVGKVISRKQIIDDLNGYSKNSVGSYLSTLSKLGWLDNTSKGYYRLRTRVPKGTTQNEKVIW